MLFDYIILIFVGRRNGKRQSLFGIYTLSDNKHKLYGNRERHGQTNTKNKNCDFFGVRQVDTKKAYAKISVQDIIDEANIGRSTFYEHFETKDELLRQKCTELFEHIFSLHGTEKTHSFSAAATFEQKITHILYHLLDDNKVAKGILSSESGEIFLAYFRKYLIETIGKEKLTMQDVPEEFLQNHIAGSFIEAVRWWVNRDFADRPENLSLYFSKVLCL